MFDVFLILGEFTPSIQTGGDVYMDIDGKNILDIRDLVIEYHGLRDLGGIRLGH